MFIFCECCVLSGGLLCDRPILCPEEYYRVCVCVCVCVRARTCVYVCHWALSGETISYTPATSGKKRPD
jgi:hypothetical protein